MLLGGIRLCSFLFEVLKDPLNYLRIFDTDNNNNNNFDLTAAVLTDFDVNVERCIQVMALCGALVTVGIESLVCRAFYFYRAWLASLERNACCWAQKLRDSA